MVTNLAIINFSADPIEKVGEKEWNTVVVFYIVETKKILNVFKKQIVYKDDLSILVSSAGITPKDLTDVDPDYYKKNLRLILDEWDETKVRTFAEGKLHEACENSHTIPEVFDYMEKYFLVDD